MPTSSKAKGTSGPHKTGAAALVRPYLGESAEDRVKGRRQKLLDTAFQLLAEDGWRKASIDNLCRHAELNKRYFYESFSSLDDLAAAVVDGLAADLINMAFTSVREGQEQGLSTEDLARKALDTVVRFITDDPRRARVLFAEVADTPQAVAHRNATIQILANALSAYGHEHHKAEGTDPIAGIASALLVGGSIEVIKAWLQGNIEVTREQLISDLSRLWVYAGDGAAIIAKARQKKK